MSEKLKTLKKGCGEEVYIDCGDGESPLQWRCGDQFNTNFTPYCDECKKKSKKDGVEDDK